MRHEGPGRADTAGKDNRAGKELPYRAYEGKRIEPAGLPAGAGRQEDETVRPGGDRAFGVPYRCDISEDERAGIVQRRNDGGRGADAGDYDFRTVGEYDAEIFGKTPIRRVYYQVGAERRGYCPGCLLMITQAPANGREPVCKLFGRPAISRRKGPDHAVATSGDHKINAGNEEHRRRNQRQAHPVANANETRVLVAQGCLPNRVLHW